MSEMEFDDEALQAFAKKVGSVDLAKEMVNGVQRRANTLGNKMISDVKANTPVDTGVLRAGWQKGSLVYGGDSFSFDISNNVNYAQYIENGHRTRGGHGWVPGRFMLKHTTDSVQNEWASYWSPIFDQVLGGIF